MCSIPGRAACCCSVTVSSPQYSARCWQSGGTSSERRPPPGPPSQRPTGIGMTTRMTAPRLRRLISAGDVEEVRTAVTTSPRLLGITVDRDGQGGWTPLHLAVADGQAEIVGVLVKAGADLTAGTEFNRTPLHVALQLHPELVPLLRELGAAVDAASAAYLDDIDQLAWHLDDGTDPRDRSSGVDLLSW